MRLHPSILFATVALGGIAVPASAATLVVTGTWSNLAFGQVQRFDPALGTLTGVTVELEALTGATYLQNALSGPYSVDTTLTGMLATNIGNVTYFGAATTTTSGAESFRVAATGRSTTMFGADDFAMFLGDGFMIVTPAGGSAPVFATTDVAGMGFVAGMQPDRTITATMRVVYDYADFAVAGAQAVPEPGTWAMMIAGFGMVGWMVRRRGDSAKAAA